MIADYDYGDVDLELAIIEQAGSVVAAQCPTKNQVTKVAHDAGRGASVRNLDLTGRFYHLSDPNAARSPGLFVRRARRLPI